MERSSSRACDPALWLLSLALVVSGCGAAPAVDRAEPADQPPVWGHEVVRVHPHDPDAFTQGLTFHDGYLYEGTGRRGASSLRRIRLPDGRVEERVDLPPTFFGEGVAVVGSRIVQLTWTARVGFVYDLESMAPIARFEQIADGWGLAWDGRALIQSDGSHRLYLLDPEDFALVRTVEVRDRGRPVRQLNELEYVDGELWANVWHSERIARIDPRSGELLGWIDLSGLVEGVQVSDPEAVLNGIAYDPAAGRLWVTGKLWPQLFEIRVREGA